MDLKQYFLLLFLFPLTVCAQLCQGSLGDPIINITFGAGANPGAPLPAATTNYTYSTTDCPHDGSYTIRSATANCFDQTWYSLTQDHTGDPNGYMMLVNASYERGDFYLDTIHGLCGSTTYEFAAWLMNLNSPIACQGGGYIYPNITFSIESLSGAILQQYSTGDIARHNDAPTWVHYGFYFTTPSGIFDVVVRMTNNAPGGCGNDIALDDITFRPCGPLITSTFAGTSTNIKDICQGAITDVSLKAFVSSGFNNPYFQWQISSNGGSWTDIPGANDTNYIAHFAANAPAGNYLFRMAAAEVNNFAVSRCRVMSTISTITIHPAVQTTAVNTSPACPGTTITLTATGGSSYAWSNNNGFTGTGPSVSIDNITASQAGKYYVLVTDGYGCLAKDSTMITINPAPVASVIFADTSICEGTSVKLSASGGTSYLWSPADDLSSTTDPSPVATPTNDTKYTVQVFDASNCSDKAYVSVSLKRKPIANAGPDKEMIQGKSVRLQGSVVGNDYTFTWSPQQYVLNDSDKLDPEVSPPSDMKYKLVVNSLEGCGSDSSSVVVHVYKELFIPNAFTPNGDGVNDTWIIPAISSISNYQLLIYNRFGQLVYQSSNYSNDWDGTEHGKPLPVATYYYILESRQKQLRLQGSVTIIR